MPYVDRDARRSAKHSFRGTFLSLPLVLLALVFGRASAQAGPPMITDDPATPERGGWEVNVAWTTSHSHGAHESEVPLLDINYGLRDNIQLKYEVPFVQAHQTGERSRNGLGNSELGVKWRFHDGGEAGWDISMYPQVEFHNPGSRSAKRGLVGEGTTVLLPLQFEHHQGSYTVGFEFGRAIPSREEDEWFGGLVAGREFGERIELLLELHGDREARGGAYVLSENAGLRAKITEHLTLLASVGRDLHNDLENLADVFGYLGTQWVF